MGKDAWYRRPLPRALRESLCFSVVKNTLTTNTKTFTKSTETAKNYNNLFFFKQEGSGVHAIPEAGGFWAIVKHMA